MNTATLSPRARAFTAILAGAALGGTGDIVFAFVYYGLKFGVSPPRILRSVASGLLGASARDGGAGTAALGLFLHFVIATGVAAVFWLGSAAWPALRRRAGVAGLGYGAVVYFVMNWVIVPLSAAPRRGGWPPAIQWPELVGHLFLVGLPVALAAAYFSRGAARPAAPTSAAPAV